MPNKKNNGKLFVTILVIFVVAVAGAWVLMKREIPVLDTKAAKKLIANFEKICRTTREPKKCKEIVGKGHTKCLLACASKTEDGEIVYSKQIYLSCLEK